MAEQFRLERKNPLPIGRYWVDVFEKQFAAFDAWLEKNRDKTDVITQENFEGGGLPFDRKNDFPPRRWYLFEVLEPVRWEGPGLPTIATPNVKNSQDTEKPTDEIVPPVFPDGPGGTAESLLGKVALGAGVVLGGAFVLSRLFR